MARRKRRKTQGTRSPNDKKTSKAGRRSKRSVIERGPDESYSHPVACSVRGCNHVRMCKVQDASGIVKRCRLHQAEEVRRRRRESAAARRRKLRGKRKVAAAKSMEVAAG